MRNLIVLVFSTSFFLSTARLGAVEVTNVTAIEGITNSAKVIKGITSLANMVNLTNLTKADAERMVIASKKFVELKKMNSLPQFGKDEKGESSMYPFSKDTQKVWIEEGWIEERMTNDITNCEYAYLSSVRTKTNTFIYFFCLTGDSLKLVSAYRYHETNWIRLPTKE